MRHIFVSAFEERGFLGGSSAFLWDVSSVLLWEQLVTPHF